MGIVGKIWITVDKRGQKGSRVDSAPCFWISILIRSHNGENTVDVLFIRIRSVFEILVVVVEFEKVFHASDFYVSEVMLMVGVVVDGKALKLFHRFDDLIPVKGIEDSGGEENLHL